VSRNAAPLQATVFAAGDRIAENRAIPRKRCAAVVQRVAHDAREGRRVAFATLGLADGYRSIRAERRF
jgi:hypothetical protein